MLVLGLFLVTAGCTQNQPDGTASKQANTDIQQEVRISNETLVAFVESAAAYVKTYGKEKALAEFNNPDGSFVDGELYIYAYDFNGTTLAHPVNPEKVGVNRLNEGEVGKILRGYINGLQNGNGFYAFTYVNPVHNMTLESKLGYAVQIDDDWWLGSGIYTGPADQSPVQ